MDAVSIIEVEEYFSREDRGFLGALRACFDSAGLQRLAIAWARDPRPWAKAQAAAYVLMPFSVPDHQPVVKRLFKAAEAAGDDAQMARFLFAFDRLVRRRRVSRRSWDWQTRTVTEEESLKLPRNRLPKATMRVGRNPRTGEAIKVPPKIPKNGVLFTYRTRYYLQRRAWRYFRGLAGKSAERYLSAATEALMQYADGDLPDGLALLDSPGILHLLFHDAAVLRRGTHRFHLRDGASLAELRPAPFAKEHWSSAAGFDALIALLTRGRARAVRTAATVLLKELHADWLAALKSHQLIALLESEDPEVQELAAGVLETSPALASMPIPAWLRLLEVRNIAVLQSIVAALRKHVAPSRLSLPDVLGLATAALHPVARLGFEILKSRALSPSELPALAALSDARCEAAAGEIAEWALGRLAPVSLEHAMAFHDSRSRAVRRAAWKLFLAEPAAPHHPALLARLMESPYADTREALLPELERRSAGAQGAAGLWIAVLLNVHRGSRAKPRAARQAAEAIARDPALAPDLLPALGALLRSLRGPEVRQALSAIAAIAEARPEMLPQLAAAFPELELAPAGAP